MRYRKSDSRQIAVGESGQGKARISKGRMFRQNLPLTQNNFYQSEDISNKAVKGHFNEKSKTPLWDAAAHGFFPPDHSTPEKSNSSVSYNKTNDTSFFDEKNEDTSSWSASKRLPDSFLNEQSVNGSNSVNDITLNTSNVSINNTHDIAQVLVSLGHGSNPST